MSCEINPFIIPFPVTIVTDGAEFAECVKYGRISRDDAMDACDECYTRIREAIKECMERGRNER